MVVDISVSTPFLTSSLRDPLDPLIRFSTKPPNGSRNRGADVASLYLLEGEGEELVMRGNVGIPDRALGQVRLRWAKGSPARSIECMRPISVAVAAAAPWVPPFPGAGRRAIPGLFGCSGAGQGRRPGRSDRAAPGHIPGTTTISSFCGALISHRRGGSACRPPRHHARANASTNRRWNAQGDAPGRPLVKGRALGALGALRRPPARPKSDRCPEDEGKRLQISHSIWPRRRCECSRRAQLRRARQGAAFLFTYLQIVGDGRLRGRATSWCGGGGNRTPWGRWRARR